jgi:hypothetical protein
MWLPLRGPDASHPGGLGIRPSSHDFEHFPVARLKDCRDNAGEAYEDHDHHRRSHPVERLLDGTQRQRRPQPSKLSAQARSLRLRSAFGRRVHWQLPRRSGRYVGPAVPFEIRFVRAQLQLPASIAAGMHVARSNY